MMKRVALALFVLLTTLAADLPAQVPVRKPREDVKIEQRLNEQVPLDLTFRDEDGRTVRLGQYFDGKPVILVLAYYRCPRLCSQVLNGLVEGLRKIDYEIGHEFTVVTV